MAKAVLTTATGSIYDDRPELRYHFPQTYLRVISAALGDYILYYEPRRDAGPASSGGRQAYFAWARIAAIDPDLVRPDHYYARIVEYTEFDHPVPFHNGQKTHERILTRPDGGTNKGAFGRAVRAISDDEFFDIVAAGFDTRLQPWERESIGLPLMPPLAGLDNFVDNTMTLASADPEWVIHPRIEQLLTRPFRDIAFKRHVRNAYNNTCAITGLRLINGGGRPEVQAAHIRPVEHDGPDTIRNGLALTATAHWLFDRGLISISDDHRLLVSSHGIPRELDRLVQPERPLLLPTAKALQPHPVYLQWHRERVFKG